MKALRFLLLSALISIVCFSSPQAQEKGKTMVPTSSSENAVKLYFKSIEAAENAELNESVNFMDEALKEDPDFFMVHAQRAIFALYNGNREIFINHADKALATRHKLNEAEQLLKEALVRLKEDPRANLTDTGKKIVKMYPKDKNSYYELAAFQSQQGDFKGAAGTYKKGIKITDNPAPFYNMLGYAYISDGELKKAEKAFNKYIELNPNHPNPYDSKGDYYMETREYDKAYNSYMKAHEINPAWSYTKAEKAKKLMNEPKEIPGTTDVVSGDAGNALANELKPGNVVGTHVINVELNEGATFEEWQEYFSKNVLPRISIFEGWKGYLLKGLRGENINQFGILYIINSEEHRNRYYNEDGSLNDNGLKSMEEMQPQMDKLQKLGSFSTVYTDWLIIE